MNKLSLDGGIFLVTNIKLIGGKERKTDKVDPKNYHPEMVNAAPESASVTANVTVQVMEDPKEYERAEGVREAARKALADVATTQTPLGLMAPHSAQEALDAAITQVHASIDEYNATAKRTFITPWIVQMALRADDRTLQQVADEVKALLDAMDDGIKKRDAEAIREAARRAKMYAEMMDEEHGTIVIAAIEEARRHAKEVAKAVKDRGDAAMTEMLLCDAAARKTAIRAARAAFLDVDLGESAPIEPLAPVAARALDVETDDEVTAEAGDLVEKPGVEEMVEGLGEDVDATRAVDADAKAAGYGGPDDAMEV